MCLKAKAKMVASSPEMCLMGIVDVARPYNLKEH